MVRFFLFLFIFVVATHSAIAQKIAEGSSNRTSDSLQVLSLNDKGNSYLLDNNPDSALIYLNRALKLAKNSLFKHEIVKNLSGIAEAYSIKSSDKESINYYRETVNSAQAYGFSNMEIENSLKLSTLLLKKSPIEALELSEKALTLYEEKDNPSGIAQAHLSLGLCYEQKGSFALAVKSFDKAVEIGRPIRNHTLVAQSLMHLAQLYQNSENYGKALDNYYQAIDIGEREDNLNLVIDAKTKIAGIYRLQGKFQQATQMLLDALKYHKEEKTLESQMNIYYALGLTIKEKGDPSKALSYLFKSQEIAKKIGAKKMMAKNNIEKGINYLTLRNTKLALQNANWALSIALKRNFYEEVMNAYKIYADAYTKTGNARLALKYHKKYDIAKDKFYTEKISQQAETLEERFRTREDELISKVKTTEEEKSVQVRKTEIEGQKQVNEKKEEIKELDAKNDKLKNNTLIGLSLLLLLFSIGTIIAYKNKMSDYHTIKLENEEILKQKDLLSDKNSSLGELNEEKSNLVNMVAHDLRSPLDQITGLINVINATNAGKKTKNQEYLDMISYATGRMRGLINRTLNIRNIDRQEIGIKNEAFDLSKLADDISDHFIELANRKNITLHSELQKNGCIVKADMNYMVQVLENLISNAIKFSPPGKNIRIKTSKNFEKVKLEIIDEGPGIREEDMSKLFKKFQRLAARPTANEDSTGLGLSIVKRFVEAMKGKVSCESTFGKGANFIVEFDAYVAPKGNKA